MTDQLAFVDVRGLSLRTPMDYVYRDVSFSVPKGKACALFASEGSGKTALMLSLCGRMKYQGGQARVGGLDVKKNAAKVRNLSAVTIIHRVNDVPENLPIADIVAAEMQLVGKKSGRAAVADYLAQWDMQDYAKESYRGLEANERLLFNIMLACAGDPALLLVDDIQMGVTQHRSIDWVHRLRDMSEQRGMTVLFATGEYDIAKHAHGVVVLSQRAEDQRQAVLADQGDGALCPVFGAGNGVRLDGQGE
ncbi:MAG: ATP-binding cassette domain-containing protein [Coriobacteriia bacterium]|nr:ATP-binding cassette domain-containing protein [Coriobacteriia bacterium]